MAQNETTTQPGGGPVYSLRKDGIICCQSTILNCGYNAETMKELRAAGYELYIDGKKAKRAKA